MRIDRDRVCPVNRTLGLRILFSIIIGTLLMVPDPVEAADGQEQLVIFSGRKEPLIRPVIDLFEQPGTLLMYQSVQFVP